MFKTTFILVMAVLCLNFSSKAQALQPGKLRPLNIGDTIPESVWNLPLQIRNHPEGNQTTTLNAYKGKLIIIDFWATWCSPCLAMLPKTNQLQNQYSSKVQFLPVTYQNETNIQALIKKTGWNPMQQLSHIISDTVLNKLFPHQGIPHYVWVNCFGMVQAITGTAEINSDTINSLLSNPQKKLSLKADELPKPFSSANSIISNQPVIDSPIVFSATLSPYRKGWPALTHFGTGTFKNRRLLIINDNMVNLFRMAFSGIRYYRQGTDLGYPFNRTIVEVKDPGYWLKPANMFCYEQIMPRVDIEKMCALMQGQLQQLLPIKAQLEQRVMPCLVLSKQGPVTNKLSATDTLFQHSPLHLLMHQQPIEKLIETLNLYLGFKHLIVVNESGVTALTNIKLKTQLTNLQAVQDALKPWGFTLQPASRTLEVLVLTDKNLN
ncbi:thiol-disulfide isomerase/thioredoxin [Pedobacter sp. AK017]|uniref:TlpA family protein disulfide reductase n=1 Tax=Pedobacter sp. AK017 TaxID=2723073 RepID=UPI00161A4112|nr:TlpA family protein disulfide reductase [Pedobacter sp. AK017]MBB5436933.1 thiol-disulfide isomerase/thioredoxin [Pedobacter sp. AK017]